MVTRSGAGSSSGCVVEVVLDDAPVHRVVHVVEDVDVADADRVFADLRRRPRGRRPSGRPSTATGRRRWCAADPRGSRRRCAPGPCVSRLMLIQNASDSIRPALAALDADPHLAPPVGRSRTPAAQPQHVLELDGPDQVDHRAAHDPQRMGLLEPHFAQLVRADVLDVPGGGVELAACPRGRRRRPAAATAMSNTSGCGSGTGIITLARPVAVAASLTRRIRSCHSPRSAKQCEGAFAALLSAGLTWQKRSSAPAFDSFAANVGSARPRWPRCWRSRRATSTRSSTTSAR